jgi:hypothetical protein
MEKKEKWIMLKYIGAGNYIPPIPARDLTTAEVKRYGGRKYLLGLGLYAPVKRAKMERAPREDKMVRVETEDKGKE